MRKSKYLLISILSLSFSFCGTKQKLIEQENGHEFEKYVDYISNDSAFKEKIKNYYKDFYKCKNLNFNTNSYVKPIKIKEFPLGILSKTKIVTNIKDFEFLSENEKAKKFELVYTFLEYYSDYLFNRNWNNECGIKLTFSKKINGILPLKYELIDTGIDPRINYQPRKGIYVFELNNENEIIDREYILFSN